MKRISALVAVLWVIFVLIPSTGSAQAGKEGIAIYNEANALKEKARTKEEKERVFAKYEQALEIFKKIKSDMWQGVILNQMGVVRAGLFRNQLEALKYYEKALVFHRKARNTQWEVVTLRNMGRAHICSDPEEAEKYFREALAVARKLHDIKEEAHTLYFIGSSFDVPDSSCDQPRRALETYEKALSVARQARDLGTEMDTLVRMGKIYRRFGQYQKALQSYENSLATAKKTKNVKSEAMILGLLAEAHGDLGRRREALDYCEKSMALAKGTSDPSWKGDTLRKIGQVYEHLEEYERALEAYQEVHARGRIGAVYLSMGDIAKAEPFLRAAPTGDGRWVMYDIPDAIRLWLMKSEYDKVLKSQGKYDSSLKRGGNVEGLFVYHTQLGLAHEALNHFDDAANEFRQAVDVTEKIRDGLTEVERANFLDNRVTYLPRITSYEGLCRVLTKCGKTVEAFKVGEATKARAFCESLSRRSEGAIGGVPQNVLDQGSEIEDRLSGLLKTLGTAYERGKKDAAEEMQSLENQVKETRAQRDAYVAKLRKDYPLFAATKYPEPMELKESALRHDEYVLEYQVTEPGIVIFLVKGKELVKGLFKQIPRKDVEQLVRKFRQPMEIGPDDSLGTKLASFDFASGKKLADILLADVLSDLPNGAPLIIIPDGPLGVVPFEMLVLNDSGKVNTDKTIPYVTGAEFFGDRNPISYYQSITALTLARTLGKQQKSGDRTLAMVDPIFSPEDARLVKAASEKRRAMLDKLSSEKLMSFKTELALEVPRLPLTAKLGESLRNANPAKTDLYEGLSAQKAILLQKDLKPYQSIVFGTHGYFGKDLPGIQEPVLILTLPGQPEGQDGFLRMTEVMGLKMNCDVAALTACQTGLGRHISGEGTMGMGRAFQYAGAKSVLMSLWSVAESSSVDLVTSFFKHLREGKTKLDALKLARDEIRKAGYDHPFFWAPFILVGEVN
ncbi:MAG: CHAT domain-containing protein [Desulfomonilaceae bacterium]